MGSGIHCLNEKVIENLEALCNQMRVWFPLEL